MQLLASQRLRPLRPTRQSEAAVRETVGPTKRRWAAPRTVRSARQTHARQFPAGLFSHRPNQHGLKLAGRRLTLTSLLLTGFVSPHGGKKGLQRSRPRLGRAYRAWPDDATVAQRKHGCTRTYRKCG